jgi:hypothetical protein
MMPGTGRHDAMAVPSSIVLAIATRGRPGLLHGILAQVAMQTVRPSRVLVCCTAPEDIAGLDGHDADFIMSAPGLPAQRNAILDQLGAANAVLFIDDDFLMAPRYIEATLRAMQSDPGVVVTTGDLIADGSKGPGFSPAEAQAMIVADGRMPPCDEVVLAPHGYGCNMAIRNDISRAHGVRFDERLPLYAWSEDMDFTHRLGRHGRIVKLLGARGVHLGVKQGRTSGHRLGYSQIANPIYLFQKGSYTLGRAARSVGRNVAANLVHSVRPEPWIDRRGRLLGNVRAVADIARGRLKPERILEL